MAKMSIEQRLADKVFETASRQDFEPEQCAYYITRCGWMVQKMIFRMVKGIILQWSLDFDNGETKGSDEYLILTMHAKNLQETIDRHAM